MVGADAHRAPQPLALLHQWREGLQEIHKWVGSEAERDDSLRLEYTEVTLDSYKRLEVNASIIIIKTDAS